MDKSTSSTQSPYAAPAGMYGMQFNAATLPVLQQFASQVSQAIQTGGAGAQTPQINRSQDASRQAFSQAQTGTAESMAARGIRGSEAEATLGANAANAGENIAAIGPNVANQFAAQAPGIGTAGGGTGALGTAISGDNTTTTSPSFWDMFAPGAGGAVTGGATAAFNQPNISTAFAKAGNWLGLP